MQHTKKLPAPETETDNLSLNEPLQINQLIAMELNLDLMKKYEKSLFMIFLGLLCLCTVAFTLIWKHYVHTWHYNPLLDGILFGVLVLIGIFLIIAGFGFSLARILGKAFIIIDEKRISIKANVFVKEQ